MERNVGGLDRTVRLVAGPVLAIAGIAALLELLPVGTLVGTAFVLVGAVLGVTGLVQRCPINQVLGVDTCPASRSP